MPRRDGDSAAALQTNSRTRRGPKSIRVIPASAVYDEVLDTGNVEPVWVEATRLLYSAGFVNRFQLSAVDDLVKAVVTGERRVVVVDVEATCWKKGVFSRQKETIEI